MARRFHLNARRSAPRRATVGAASLRYGPDGERIRRKGSNGAGRPKTGSGRHCAGLGRPGSHRPGDRHRVRRPGWIWLTRSGSTWRRRPAPKTPCACAGGAHQTPAELPGRRRRYLSLLLVASRYNGRLAVRLEGSAVIRARRPSRWLPVQVGGRHLPNSAPGQPSRGTDPW